MAAIILSTVLLLVVLFAPLVLYIRYGWEARRRQIIDLFPPKAISLYYQTYFPACAAKDFTPAGFSSDFDKRYGRRHFLVPGCVLFGIAAFLLFLCIHTIALEMDPAPLLSKFQLPLVVVACAAGAYIWVVYDFVVRERNLDFSTTHVNRAAFRLAIAAPVAYAISPLLAKDLQIPAAILLGAFPTDTLMWFLRRRGAQLLGLQETEKDRSNRLRNLPSLDAAAADRIRIEGITSINQLANSDPIALTIRTGLSFRFILDCVSEALAWYYLGREGLAIGQKCSAPGTLEVYGLIQELDYADDPKASDNQRYMEDKRLAGRTLVVIAGLINNMDPAVLERILRTIWSDSRVTFLFKLMVAIEEMRSTTLALAGDKLS